MKKQILFMMWFLSSPVLIFAQWNRLPGGGLGLAVCCDNSAIYTIGTDQSVYRYTNGWQVLPGDGKGLDIAARNGTVWVIGTDYRLYMHTAGQWSQMPDNGLGLRITVDQNTGVVWTIGTNQCIYSMRNGRWYEYPGAGQGTDIAALDDVPYVVGTDKRVYKGTGPSWQRLPGEIDAWRIAVDAVSRRIYMVDTRLHIYVFENENWRELPHMGLANDICAYAYIVTCIGTDNQFYQQRQ